MAVPTWRIRLPAYIKWDGVRPQFEGEQGHNVMKGIDTAPTSVEWSGVIYTPAREASHEHRGAGV